VEIVPSEEDEEEGDVEEDDDDDAPPTCPICSSGDPEPTLKCEECEGYYHLSCVGLTGPEEDWQCSDCKSEGGEQAPKRPLDGKEDDSNKKHKAE
jgi:hypothetical protein